MSNIDSVISEQFSHLAEHAPDVAANLFEHVAQLIIAHSITEGLIAFAVGYAMATTLQRRTRKALQQGDFKDDNALFADTTYSPSGIINPATGNEFMDQRIRAIDHDLELEKIFPPSHSKVFMEYIMKASKHCTKENPIVFDHLDKVIKKPEQLAKVKNFMSQRWINYFSKALGGQTERATNRPDGRLVPEEREFLPLLVFEPDVPIQRFRVFLMTPEDLDIKNLPNLEDIRVEINNQMIHDPKSYYNDRLTSYRNIAKRLSSEDAQWIKNKFMTKIPTGNLDVIPEPANDDIGLNVHYL